jgi:HK97 family phage portal protein
VTVGLRPLAPQAVTVDIASDGTKTFTVALANGGRKTYGTEDVTHIRALSTDGVIGLSPISAARQAIGTGLAADKTAAKQFGSGLLMGGIVTPSDQLTEEEGRAIKEGLQARIGGHEHAGEIIVASHAMTFSPWSMNAKDAQFIESRAFQIEEVSRLFGIPKVLLSEDGASTWGSGIAELIRGFQRFTLNPWTSRIEERLSQTLAPGLFCEFDFAGLMQGSPADVTANLAAEIAAGLRTVNEARAILNLPPLPATEGGDA